MEWESRELYDGAVEIAFAPARHWYRLKSIGGERVDRAVPSVTGVTGLIDKPWLGSWMLNQMEGYLSDNLESGRAYEQIEINELLRDAKGAYKKSRDRAADIGTLVHEWASKYIKSFENGLVVPLPEDSTIRPACLAFTEWWLSSGYVLLESERFVYSLENDYTGTVDIVAAPEDIYDSSGDVVIDIKTGRGVYFEAQLQTAAYAQALNEEGYDVKKRIILHIDRDTGDVTPYDIEQLHKVSPKDYCSLESGISAFNGLRKAYAVIKGV